MREVKTYAVNCNDAWLNTKGDDISDSYVKYADYQELAVQLANAESKCRELAAENGRCKFEISRCHQTVDEMFKNRDKWVDKEWLSAIWSTSKRLMNETPATSAFLSEVRASELDSLAGVAETMLVKFSNQRCSQDMHEVVGWKMVLQQASNRAAQLRKGAAL